MTLNASKFLRFALFGALLANAFLTLSLFRPLREVSSYRSEVESLAVDFYNYCTNLEYQIYCLSAVSQSPTNSISFSGTSVEYAKSIGSLSQYTYAVVRGCPGLLCGRYFYPVGSPTAYGMITLCGPDFVEFDGLRRFVLVPHNTSSDSDG